MKSASAPFGLVVLCVAVCAVAVTPSVAAQEQVETKRDSTVSLDFNNLELPVFVKFISELTGKNFVIDEKVKGKVTVFSPVPVTADRAYQVFLAVLEGKGLTTYAVGDVVRIVPIIEVPTERSIHVYTLAHANAEEMAKVLASLASKAPAPGVVRQETVRLPGEFDGPVQVLADKATNSLIVAAAARDFERLRTVIEKLDIRRRQVFVEVAILEVNVNKLRALGNDLSGLLGYSSKDVSVLGGFNRAPEDIFNLAQAITSAGPAGAALRLGTGNIRTFLQALITTTDANVLSTPQILATDNQRARIVVGQNVPILTGSTTSNVGAATVQTVERRDVGVTLDLTPQILEGDRVRLDIRQEISALTGTDTTDILTKLGPTLDKRETITSVIVNNQESVALGGLLKDNLTITERKIPLLGDIPILGWLFRFNSRTVEKSNLLVFLTPTIIKEPSEAQNLRTKKSGEMKEFLQENQVEDREKRKDLLKE